MDNVPTLLSDEFINSFWIFFEANLSSRTRREYFNVLKGFVRITQKDPLHLTQQDVDFYCKYLEQQLNSKKLSYTTALMRISVMRTLCEFIRHRKQKQGYAYINYFRDVILKDIDKTLEPETLPTNEELNALLQMAEQRGDETAFMIFSLVIKCGLTSSEISSLDTEFLVLDMNDSFCIQFPAKKRLSRIIKLPPDIHHLLLHYIDAHQIDSGPIFLNRRHNRMQIRDAERLLKKYIQIGMEKKCISKPFTLQIMRHAAFKYMLQGGARETDVAAYGGITDKWMSRYRKVIQPGTEIKSADLSVLSIRYKEET